MPTLLSRIPAGFGVAYARWTQTGDPEEVTTSWGFTDDGATAANTIAAGMATRWGTPSAAGNMAIGWQFVGVTVYINRGGIIIRGEGLNAITGTWAVGLVPSAIALIVKKRTNTIGRRYRGRMFLPAAFLDRANLAGTGIYNTVGIAAFQTRMAAWLAAEIATVYDPVLIHAAALATAPSLITSVVVANPVGVIRKRMR